MSSLWSDRSGSIVRPIPFEGRSEKLRSPVEFQIARHRTFDAALQFHPTQVLRPISDRGPIHEKCR